MSEETVLTLNFNKELYPKESLIKAAYAFIGECYVYLNQNDTDYIVELTTKSDKLPEHLPDKFKNELLAQTVRLQVYKQTHVIRELLMARAMASTIVGEPPQNESEEDEINIDLSEITRDWFEKYEQR